MFKKTFALLVCSTLISVFSLSTAFAAWEDQNGAKKYFNETSNEYFHNDWQQIDGSWYYFDKDGNMTVGWQKIKKDWYYLDESTGIMKTGWFQDKDGQWYYLDDENGDMLTSKWTPDGFFVNKSGVYDPSKGNKFDKKKIGPDEKVAQAEKSNTLLGVSFPTLSNFAATNLATDTWGIEGSKEALLQLGQNIRQNLVNQGISANGDNAITIDGNTITYTIDGINPKLKLVKAGDRYDIYDYGTIDKNAESPLMGMCSVISSAPQTIYNAIYTAAEYDQRVMRSDYYTNFGDSKILYTVYNEYIVFSIKAK